MVDSSILRARLEDFYSKSMKHPTLFFSSPDCMENCYSTVNAFFGSLLYPERGGDCFKTFLRDTYGCQNHGFVETLRLTHRAGVSDRELYDAFSAAWLHFIEYTLTKPK
jgi:hypothetical protein